MTVPLWLDFGPLPDSPWCAKTTNARSGRTLAAILMASVMSTACNISESAGGSPSAPTEAIEIGPADSSADTPIRSGVPIGDTISIRDTISAATRSAEQIAVEETIKADIEPAQTPLEPIASPDEILPEVPAVSVGDDEEVLAQVDPVDKAPVPGAIPDQRDGKRRNDIGELVTIDESASLACGNAEIAIAALDQGESAAAKTHLVRAAHFATESNTDGIQDWATALLAAATSEQNADEKAAILVGFLSACSDGGYEL